MENRKRSVLLIVGFLLFVIGMISLMLNLVNVRLTIMNPIEDLGFIWAISIKLLMVMSGLILVYIIQSDR